MIFKGLLNISFEIVSGVDNCGKIAIESELLVQIVHILTLNDNQLI